MVSDVPKFITNLIDSLYELWPHLSLALEQAKYLRELKKNLEESSVIFLGYFPQNYSFVVQDEVQSFHWKNMICTNYPVMIYYKSNDGSLSHVS